MMLGNSELGKSLPIRLALGQYSGIKFYCFLCTCSISNYLIISVIKSFQFCVHGFSDSRSESTVLKKFLDWSVGPI